MNSLNIIKALCRDADFAEYANVVRWDSIPYPTVADFCQEWFGCKIKGGEIIEGQEYVYLYAVDHYSCPTALQDMGKPDVVLERLNPEDAAFDDQEVWLWKIE